MIRNASLTPLHCWSSRTYIVHHFFHAREVPKRGVSDADAGYRHRHAPRPTGRRTRHLPHQLGGGVATT